METVARIWKRKPWSIRDIEFIKMNYQHTPVVEIAERLNRSRSAVYRIAQDVGVRKGKRYADLADSVKIIQLLMSRSYHVWELAEKLDIHERTVQRHIQLIKAAGMKLELCQSAKKYFLPGKCPICNQQPSE